MPSGLGLIQPNMFEPEEKEEEKIIKACIHYKSICQNGMYRSLLLYVGHIAVTDMISLWLDCYQTAYYVLLILHKPCSRSQSVAPLVTELVTCL